MRIHVTGFFSDPGGFEVLRRTLFPRIIKAKPPGEPIRVWVPGCSTGEEVYSIAMTLVEFIAERKLRHPIQIFGTDILESALEKARAGVYTQTIKTDLTAGQLRRSFVTID